MGTDVLAEGRRSSIGRLWQFLRLEVPGEVRKVTWPTWPELKKATLVILAFVAVLGVAIGWLDVLLQFGLVTLLARMF